MQYIVDTVADEVEIKKHYCKEVVWVLGAMVIAGLILLDRWEIIDLELLLDPFLGYWSQIQDWLIDMAQFVWAQMTMAGIWIRGILFPDMDPLTIYSRLRLGVSIVSIVTFAVALYQSRRWIAQYRRRLPRSWQRAATKSVLKGVFSAIRRFVREEWPRVVLLVCLLLVLAGLNVAIYLST